MLCGLQPLEPRMAFAVGPSLVADINALPASSLAGEILGSGAAPATPQFVTVGFASPTNALTVYAADDGAHGRELWVSDGTPTGTRMLQDINRSTASDGRPGGSDPADFFIAGSTLYFSANDGVHGRELWQTDGTSSGTVLVKDLVPGGGAGDPRDYAILPSGEVLFVAQSGLWKTNGTAAGTVAIDPTNTLNLDFDRTSFTRVSGLTRLGSRVLFAGGPQGGSFGTTELWSTDGTLANTVPLRQSGGAAVDSPRDFTVVTEFVTTPTSPGVPSSPGLPGFGGTGPSTVTFSTDIAFFSAAGGLWRMVDGTSTVPELVSPIAPSGALVAFGLFSTGDSFSSTSGSRLVFAGDDGTTGTELWSIEGRSSSVASPTPIRNINQTTVSGFENGSFPADFRVAGSNLFFTADDGINGRELWKYDGVTAAMLRDVRPGRTPPSATEIFSSTTTFTASAFVQGAAVADFNGDGKPDLVLELDAATVGASETLQVFLGVGDGSFTEGASLTYGPQTAGSALNISGLATGDVNNDGRADIVISRDVLLRDRTSVFLGNGDGTFGAERVFSDTGFTDLTIADVDRDGKPDLVTFTGFPELMRGNGDGTFQDAVMIYGVDPSDGYRVDGGTVGDVDGDGDADLVALDLTNNQAVLLLNRGDGTFEPERFLPLGAGPISVAVADVNADDRPDIVTGNFNSLSILLGTGGGLFASPRAIALPGAHTNIAIVDVDGDSRLDIVTSTLDTTGVFGAAGVNVLRGRGDGTFAAATRAGPTNGSLFLAVSDFDGSGRPDVAVHAGADVTVLLNSGSNGSPAGSEPVFLATSGSTLYFSADDGVNGRELWKSDGSSAGTALVKDIHAGSKSAFSQDSSATYLSAAVLGGELLFAADDGQHGVELWKSDGTPGGTVLLEDINIKTADGLDGFSSSSGAALSAALFDGAVYFPADDGIHGTELWKRVGDAAPQLVKDLNPDTATFNGGEPEFVAAGNLLFFTWPRQETSLHGGTFPVTDLWRTDGTEAGTILLRQNVGASGSAALAALDGKVIFSATDLAGTELWISDGTVAGTTPLKDIAASGDGSPRDFFSFGSLVLFTADDGTNGRELWKTDGTPTGTVLLADIDPTTSSGPASGIQNSPGFTLFGGRVYFQANDGTRGAELWRTDGTTTSLFFDLNTTAVPDPFNSAVTLPGSGSPYALTPFGSILLFGADDGVNGTSLWKTDGTAVGTSLIRNVAPFPSNVRPFSFTVAGGKAFFGATDGTRDRLWQTDGTTAGTAVVPDVDPAYVTRDIGNVLAVGNEVFFSADRRFVGAAMPAGRALFRSDGTVAGTSIVELSPGVVGARQFPIIATADRLYFGADDIVRGLELWQLPFDTIPPTVTITTDRTALGSGQTAAVAFALSELPAGFSAGAVTVTGGTLTNFAGTGTAYTATFVPQPNFAGTATIQVAAGAFTDAAGNPNTASAVTSIVVDTIPPTVLVTLGTQSLGIGQTAAVSFTLDKPSTTFTADDVTVVGGTLTNFAGTGTTYTATFVPQANFVGTATIQVAAGAFTDASGNPNLGIPPLPILIDTRPRGVLAVGTAGNLQTASREFAYAASSPTTIRISGLSAVQSGFFSPRIRLTVTPTDAISTFAVGVLRRSYDPRSRTVSVTLDRAIPVVPATGTLVLGDANAPAARLIDANTGGSNREVGGADLVAAGYAPAFVTRFQGGLRVAAGDVDGDGLPDLAAAPGATPARTTVDFGRSTRLVSLFSGQASPAWPAATVDVSAVFPNNAGEGFFVALGNVAGDTAGSGVRELVVASGRRVAVFEVLVAAGIPSIVPTPLRVVDLEAPGRITAVAAGPLFASSGFDDIVVASTTGTQRVAGTTTVTVLGGVDLQALRSFRVSSLVESGPARRLVNVFGRGASLAVGDVDGDGRRDLVLGAGANGLGNFRVLANEFVTASTASSNRAAFSAAIDAQLGNTSRFGHRRPAGPKWKPTGGPDFFTPGDASGPTGSGFNAPLSVATVTGDVATGGKAWVFAALGATNQTGSEVRRLLYASPGTWTRDVSFSQVPGTQSSNSAGTFRPGTGLRLG
jgi:ELWxxDGT repeat protein